MTKILKPLPAEFFQRSGLEVARDLLGQYLIRITTTGEIFQDLITEVEFYGGEDDSASHVSRGMTKRNEIMFKQGGYWYVYVIYGLHCMLNIVTGLESKPEAVLIRGLQKVTGPGRLTKKMIINQEFNGKLSNEKTGLYIASSGLVVSDAQVILKSRIGIDYASPTDQALLWNLSVDEKF